MTLTLLKTVWGSVLWPTTTCCTMPVSVSTVLTSNGSRSLSTCWALSMACCCSTIRSWACRRTLPLRPSVGMPGRASEPKEP